MSVYAFVFSPTGGTRKVAEILAAVFDPKYKMVDLMSREADFSAITLTARDICIVAIPSFGGRVPDTATQRISAVKGKGAVAVPVVVYGNRAIDDTMLELVNTLAAADFRCAAGISAVAEHSVVRKFAAGRPDEDDAAQLRDFARSIKERIDADEIPEKLSVPGNEPYRPFGGLPLVPAVEPADCLKCGLCAARCPVGAIPMDDPCAPADKDKCISCMACIAVCPKEARKLDENFISMMGERMAEVCGGHKPNELFM